MKYEVRYGFFWPVNSIYDDLDSAMTKLACEAYKFLTPYEGNGFDYYDETIVLYRLKPFHKPVELLRYVRPGKVKLCEVTHV